MPTVNELIAHNRTEEEIAGIIGADWLIYQDIDALIRAVQAGNRNVRDFDLSCFNGKYVTGDVNADYLKHIECLRNDGAKTMRETDDENLLDLSNNA